MFGTKQRNPVKLNRTRKLRYLILGVFWLLLLKFNSWKLVTTQIWNFSKISSFPEMLSLMLQDNSWDNSSLLYYITSFVLLVANRTCNKKLQNIMIRFVWKVFLLSLFPMMLQVTRKRNSKKIFLFKKLLINKAERFLKSQFNLNRVCKIFFIQNL